MTEEQRTLEYTDLQLQFLELIRKYPVKSPETIVDYVSSQGETVLENPELLAESLSECEISPVRRRQILKHWFAEKGVEVPPELLKKLPPEDRRRVEVEEEEKRERERAKYSVDDDTGAIKVATTAEKALTWDEADKLSKAIKKEIAGREGGKAVTYVYDTETRGVRMAKEGERGGTLEQAKELKRMAEERKTDEVESPFTLDEEGNWILNPKARVTGIELMALESIRRSQERGERIDPLEALSDAASKMKVYQEALGGGAKLPDWMTDPLEFQKTIKELTKGEGEDTKALREQISELSKSLQEMRDQRVTDQINTYRGEVRSLKEKLEELTDELRESRHAVGSTAIDLLRDAVDRVSDKLPDRRDIREIASEVLSKRPRTPRGRGAAERERELEGMASSLEAEAELRDIEDIWFFRERR